MFNTEALNGVTAAITQLSEDDPDFKTAWDAMAATDRTRYAGYCQSQVAEALNGARTNILEMREGFRESYVCEIAEDQDVMVLKLRDQLLHETDLTTLEGVEEATALQWASVVIESIFLAVAVFTVRLPRPSGAQLSRMSTETAAAIGKSSALQAALATIKATPAGATLDFAKAVYGVIRASNAVGLVGKIVKMLFTSLSWLEWGVVGIQVVAYIIAAVASGGAALIAKVVIILADAFWFFEKLVTMNSLETRHKTLLAAA